MWVLTCCCCYWDNQGGGGSGGGGSFSSHARFLCVGLFVWGWRYDESFPASLSLSPSLSLSLSLSLSFFLSLSPCLIFNQVDISSSANFHSLCQDQSTVAQRAETTVDEPSLTSWMRAYFPNRPPECERGDGVVFPQFTELWRGLRGLERSYVILLNANTHGEKPELIVSHPKNFYAVQSLARIC